MPFNLANPIIFLQTNCLVTLLLVGLYDPSLAQLTPAYPDWERFTKRTYLAGGDTLRYRLLYLLNYDSHKTYPLLLYLHGNGERGNDRPIDAGTHCANQ